MSAGCSAFLIRHSIRKAYRSKAPNNQETEACLSFEQVEKENSVLLLSTKGRNEHHGTRCICDFLWPKLTNIASCLITELGSHHVIRGELSILKTRR
jgi:hypothetical protein